MPDLICPFSATLVKSDFACQHATQIIRRGGAEIACASESTYTHCHLVHQNIKNEALKSMGLEDDLLSLPHSVLVKIQFGGLLALQVATANDSGKIADISRLILSAKEQFNDLTQLPFDTINTVIAEYKISRRSRK